MKSKPAYTNYQLGKISQRVEKARSDCRFLITNILNEEKTICGIGCPGRSAPFLVTMV